MRFYKVGGAGEKQCSWRRVPRHRTEGGGGWVGSGWGGLGRQDLPGGIGSMAGCAGIGNMASFAGIGNMASFAGGWIGHAAIIAGPCIYCRHGLPVSWCQTHGFTVECGFPGRVSLARLLHKDMRGKSRRGFKRSQTE